MKKLVIFSFFFVFLLGSGFTSNEMIPTSLKINIRNDLGNIESDVVVTLYGSETDFQQEKNPVQSGKTNDKGMVTFKGLDAKIYYVSAVKGDKNNYGAGVQTGKLEAKRVNKVTIIIE